MKSDLVRRFYHLEVWQRAHNLVLEIYKVTKGFPKEEFYGIVNQLRRASSSITANLAEGFERYHLKDKIKFYYHSRGSVAEVQNFLFLSKDLGYLAKDLNKKLIDEFEEIAKLINCLIKSLNNIYSERKSKFPAP